MTQPTVSKVDSVCFIGDRLQGRRAEEGRPDRSHGQWGPLCWHSLVLLCVHVVCTFVVQAQSFVNGFCNVRMQCLSPLFSPSLSTPHLFHLFFFVSFPLFASTSYPLSVLFFLPVPSHSLFLFFLSLSRHLKRDLAKSKFQSVNILCLPFWLLLFLVCMGIFKVICSLYMRGFTFF